MSGRNSKDTPSQRLLDAAREKRLILFAGAGISMDQPTALPSWWDLSACVVRSIGARASKVVQASTSFADIVVNRQKSERFPADYVAEKVVNSIGDRYFEVLRCIDSDRPNPNHLALAELAATSKLRAILTTNFDRTIEAAFAARGIPLQVRADPEAAKELIDRWEQFESGRMPCQLLKLHGTADRPDTVIDTLAQRARGTPVAYLECVQQLLAFGAWGFIGFSGADLDTQPDYLGLSRGAPNGCGISWMVESGKQPRAAVQRLVNEWQSKAEIFEGDLPGVLLRLLEGVTPLQPLAAKSIPVDLSKATMTWAEGIPERRCALIMAELVDQTGETARARAALEQLAATYPQHQWKLQTGWSGETLVLKADDDSGAPHRPPLGFGDPSNPSVVLLAPESDANQADWQNYADTLYGLSDVLDRLGDKGTAATIAKRAILAALYARAGRTSVVRALGVLADLQAQSDQDEAHKEAERLYSTAIKQAEPRSRISANLSVNRGRNALQMDRKQAAFDMFTQATQIFRSLGDEHGRAGVGLALAELCAQVGDNDRALFFWSDALEFAQRVGDEPICFEASMGIGKVHWARGEIEPARAAFKEALRAARTLRDPNREESALKAIAEAV